MAITRNIKNVCIGVICAALLGVTAVSAQEMPQIDAERTGIFGSTAELTSDIPITNYTFGGRYLGDHVNAPLQSVQVLHFDKPPSDVFPMVHSGNAEWSLQIDRLQWDHSASETAGALGVGSVRRCDFAGGAGIAYERVIAIEEDRMIAYDLDADRSTAPLPIKDFFVIWTLEPKEGDGTLVTARIYFNEAQDMGGEAASAVVNALAVDFRNFANVFGGVYVVM